MRLARTVGVIATLLAAQSFAGEKWLKYDNFTGSGSVSVQATFGEYEGAGVLFTPAATDYPVTLIAVDVFVAPTSPGSGAIAAYLIDIWDESVAVAPPTTNTGNRYTSGVQYSASTTQFNRYTLSTPVVINSGRFFIGIREQFSSSFDGTTIAMDQGPVVTDTQYFYKISGWTKLTGTGTGTEAINRNWIIRAVLSTPDIAPTVISIDPTSGSVDQDVPVTISGSDFTSTSRVFLENVELTVTSRVPPTTLYATVPKGFTPGVYDVVVVNPGNKLGTLPKGYSALGTDAGTTPEQDAGTTPEKDAGVDPQVDGGIGDEDAGTQNPDALALESIDPTDIFSEDESTLLLLGRNFDADAQVLIGKALVDKTARKSGSVIEATLKPGTAPGVYDVTVINSNGDRAMLAQALTVHSGTSVGTGCNCNAVSPLLPVAFLASLVILRGRRRR